MKNFQGSTRNNRKYVFYYKLSETEAKLFKDTRTDLKIELTYTLGGYNYFSGNQNPRGYKLYFTPVARGNGVSGMGFEESTLMGDQFDSGFYVGVETADRYNAKRLGQLAEALDANLDQLGRFYCEKANGTLLICVKNYVEDKAPAVKSPKVQVPVPAPAMKSTQVVLTKEVLERLPKLYSQEDKKPEEVKVIVKFFDPTGSWTWYATEGEPTGEKITSGAFAGEDDYKFFGYVQGFEGELGYFTLGELSTAKALCKGLQALPIERDIRFGFNTTLAEVMAKEGARS